MIKVKFTWSSGGIDKRHDRYLSPKHESIQEFIDICEAVKYAISIYQPVIIIDEQKTDKIGPRLDYDYEIEFYDDYRE